MITFLQCARTAKIQGSKTRRSSQAYVSCCKESPSKAYTYIKAKKFSDKTIETILTLGLLLVIGQEALYDCK